ncbi:hypothetical protein SDC9_182607 [bioreactor metagenome]|uniref:Uncharacterized protein n=1 Tax=bioreactor metagenome TaxID=1076179 RepID=A0A645H9Q7_9ZZZZ
MKQPAADHPGFLDVGGVGVGLVDGNRGGKIPVGADISLQTCRELVHSAAFILGKVAPLYFCLPCIGIEA